MSPLDTFISYFTILYHAIVDSQLGINALKNTLKMSDEIPLNTCKHWELANRYFIR